MGSITETNTEVSELRELFAKDSYSAKYGRDFFAGTEEGKGGLIVRQQPEGFTSFVNENNQENSEYMYDSGRTLEVSNPEPVRPANPKYTESRARRRYKKKSINLWSRLLGNEEDLELNNGNLSVKCRLSRDVSAICAEQFREEYYLPFAYLENDRPVGGNYLHLWEAGTVEQLKLPRAPLSELKYKEVFTGGCMFGVPLYGEDKNGGLHSLTSPYSEIPEGCEISTIHSPYDVHPDETVTRESLINLIPLVKTAGTDDVKIRYHLPTANYYIYGINWYLKNNLTKKALCDYFAAVKMRATEQRNFLERLSFEHDIPIHCCSSLDILGLDNSEPERMLVDLLDRIGLSESELSTENLFEKILNYLAEAGGTDGDIWSYLRDCINSEAISVDRSCLLSINYMDYSANLAAAAYASGDRQALSILPSHESPVTHWYKKILAEKFGAVTCLQWLAPIQFHIPEFRYRIFYADSYIENLNQLFKKGIINRSFLQTASVALDSPVYGELMADQISQILKKHEESVLPGNEKEAASGTFSIPAKAI